jgi:hypothetical protein
MPKYYNKKKIKMNSNLNTHIIFTKEGEKISKFEKLVKQLKDEKNIEKEQNQYADVLKKKIEDREEDDKAKYGEFIRDRKRKKKFQKDDMKILERIVNDLGDGMEPTIYSREERINSLNDDEDDGKKRKNNAILNFEKYLVNESKPLKRKRDIYDEELALNILEKRLKN